MIGLRARRLAAEVDAGEERFVGHATFRSTERERGDAAGDAGSAEQARRAVGFAEQAATEERREQHRDLARRRDVAERRELHRVEDEHVAERAENGDDERGTPLRAPELDEAAPVAQRRRQQERQAKEVADVVDQDRREQQDLDRVAVDQRVARDQHAGERAPDEPGANARALRGIMRLGPERRPAGDEEDADHDPGDAGRRDERSGARRARRARRAT